MDDSLFTVSQLIKQRDFIQFLTCEFEALTRYHLGLLALYCEDTVDISSVRRLVLKWCDTDGN